MLVEHQTGTFFNAFDRGNVLLPGNAEQGKVDFGWAKLCQATRLVKTFQVVALLPSPDKEDILGGVDSLGNLDFKERHLSLNIVPYSFDSVGPAFVEVIIFQAYRKLGRCTIVAKNCVDEILNKFFIAHVEFLSVVNFGYFCLQ